MFLTGILGKINSSMNSQVVSNVLNVERSIIGNILNIIRLWGTGIALIMLTYMAISYFMADRKINSMVCSEKS